MSLPSYYSIYDSFVLDTTGNIGIGTAYPKSVIDITNRKDAIIIPSKDVDNTSEPVPETPNVNANKVGVLRMNKAYGRFEKKLGTNWTQTSIWQPVIVSANPTKLQNAGMQTTVNGVLFEINSVWSFVGNDGTNYPCISQFVNPSQVILTRPDVFPVSKSPYRIRVYNGEAAKEYVSSSLLIDAGVGPTFTTPAGSLSNLLPDTAYSMVISATDELYGGISNISIDSELTGSGLSATFSNNSLTIGGTSVNVQSLTSFNFLSTAIDLGGNTSTRSYSFTIGPLYTNLVSNYTINGDSGWTGGNGYYMNFSTNQVGEFPRYSYLLWSHHPFNTATLSQTITLTPGSPTYTFSFDYGSQYINGSGDQYRGEAIFKNSSGTTIHTIGTGSSNTPNNTAWYRATYTTTVDVSSATSVQIILAGRDSGGWEGYYGSRLTNVALYASSPAPVPSTVTNVTATRTTPTSALVTWVGAVSKYHVRAVPSSGTTLTFLVNEATVTISTLVSGVQYTITIIPENAVADLGPISTGVVV